ncbi:hypothetical protein FS749_006575 [Ceratobasidium sp. UAMH 11750]|nr:hypothetical protein FS749_006575 [Ceratobasidium sp. UAMH 11750]
MATVQPRRPRHIIILCDGTGKNGPRDSARGEPTTNIWRLCQAIRPVEGDIVEYIPGVGAPDHKLTTTDLLAQVYGHTVVDLIRNAYLTISRNYKDGDNISLFGYQRGAFIVRKVASLMGAVGLITDEARFEKLWQDLVHRRPWKRTTTLPLKPCIAPISCLGVWHTVGAIRPRGIQEELNLLGLPDDDLPEAVQLTLHAIAYHENRKLQEPILFNPITNNNKQLCKQVLFAGGISDVGGGGTEPKAGRNILPDVTLDWMLRNIPQTIQAVLSRKLESEVPRWYPITSPFHSVPLSRRILDKLHKCEYFLTTPGLLRHRTLSGLPSPESPYLLEHTWDWEQVDSLEEEVAHDPPTSKQPIIRHIMDNTELHRSPTPPCLYSLTTNQTEFTMDMSDTMSMLQMSLASTLDLSSEI